MRYRRTATRYLGVISVTRQLSVFDLLSQGSQYVLVQSMWRPATDVAETADSVVVTVDLAGTAEDDLEIVLHDNALVIEGERRFERPAPDAVYHAVEIRQGRFRVEVPLPGVAFDDGIEAALEQGLLRVRLPKRARAGR